MNRFSGCVMSDQIFSDIQPGTIFVSSWGYDQTNIDFYQVISRTSKMVTVRAIRTKSEPAHVMGSYVEPIPNAFLDSDHPFDKAFGGPIRCKLLGIDRPFLKISSCQHAYLWDGKRRTETYTG